MSKPGFLMFFRRKNHHQFKEGQCAIIIERRDQTCTSDGKTEVSGSVSHSQVFIPLLWIHFIQRLNTLHTGVGKLEKNPVFQDRKEKRAEEKRELIEELNSSQ